MAKLTALLTLNTAGFQSALKTAKSETSSLKNSMAGMSSGASKGFASMGSAMKSVAKGPAVVAAAVAAAGAAIGALTYKLILSGEAANSADARVRNIAKSMGLFGDQSDVVAERLNNLADKIELQTGVDGNAIQMTQANVQDRDLGGFVEEIEQKLKTIDMEGMTYKMTGEFENQRRFTKTMVLVIPMVMLVIFVLLYFVYHSALEAAHVMLAVPFALSGGVLLQKMLGYNFNGAVWVGYIALFGTAVQTGVVMVVYLEETVKTRLAEKGAAFTYEDLVQAVKDGARLRLRPKVMTVATIVASLLPIMWSHRQGTEIMKPLATPVIGGMISSLLHILIVTPVIFLWLRGREFRNGTLLESLSNLTKK